MGASSNGLFWKKFQSSWDTFLKIIALKLNSNFGRGTISRVQTISLLNEYNSILLNTILLVFSLNLLYLNSIYINALTLKIRFKGFLWIVKKKNSKAPTSFYKLRAYHFDDFGWDDSQLSLLQTTLSIHRSSLKRTKVISNKDTNRKIWKTEFIYICGSKNGSSSSAVNTGDIWGDVHSSVLDINLIVDTNVATTP